MELFARAKVVRLRSHHVKFLYADEVRVGLTMGHKFYTIKFKYRIEL
jgi:hypothetical protein